MKIIPGPASRNLAFRIGNLIEADVVPIEFKRFPDGESYIRFTEEIEDEDVAIVQTTGSPQDSNLLQLLLGLMS